MSYDIFVHKKDSDETLILNDKNTARGGTYAINGTNEAWLNITWNYAPFFYKTIDVEKGIRALYGKTPEEAIIILNKAISRLDASTESDDYWQSTAGNARKALQNLRGILLQVIDEGHKDVIVDGD